MKLLALVKFLRFEPFDQNTPEGRSQERYRLALWSFMANILSKTMAFVVIMLSVRWTLPYLGEERFGIWMTVVSFSVILMVLDLGIGSALVNHAANAAAEEDGEKLKKTISGSLGLLYLVAIAITCILSFTIWALPIEKLIKVNDISLIPEIRQILYVFAILFGFNIFGSGVQRLFIGLQRIFEVFLVSAACSTLALACLWWAVQLKASTPILLLTTMGIQSIGGYILFILLIFRKKFELKNIRHDIGQQYNQLIKVGTLFLILQLGGLLGTGSDSLILSSTLGVASVAVYSVVQRLFQICTMSLQMFSSPLWGAYADAKARQDTHFIRVTFLRSLQFTCLLSIFILLVMVIFSDTILKIWISNTINIPKEFLIAFAIVAFIECMLGPVSVFLNGMNAIKPQIASILIVGMIAVPLKLWLVQDHGLVAIAIINIMAYIVATGIVYGVLYKNEIQKHLS